MSADHFNYSEALQLYKDSTTGEVLLARGTYTDEAGSVLPYEIPSGKCELFCCDAEGKKLARILFVLEAK